MAEVIIIRPEATTVVSIYENYRVESPVAKRPEM